MYIETIAKKGIGYIYMLVDLHDQCSKSVRIFRVLCPSRIAMHVHASRDMVYLIWRCTNSTDFLV